VDLCDFLKVSFTAVDTDVILDTRVHGPWTPTGTGSVYGAL